MLSRKTLNYKLSNLNSSGFTLLELLVVLTIMALLTGMSAPAISGYLRGARLRGGAREISSALRLARQLAITERSDHTVHFDTERRFWVEQDGNLIGERRTLPDTIDFYSTPPPPSYTFTTFTARGTANDGDIFIIGPGDRGRKIEVTGATGHITINHWSP